MIQGSLNKILLFTYNAIILTHLIKIPWLKQREFITLCYTNFFFLKQPRLLHEKKKMKKLKDKLKPNTKKPIENQYN